nr:MAG TPA: hypothetical protein [Caudoviricetes sp.]
MISSVLIMNRNKNVKWRVVHKVQGHCLPETLLTS